MRAITLLTFVGILISSFGIISGNEAALRELQRTEEDRSGCTITKAIENDLKEVWDTCQLIFSDIKLKSYWEGIKASNWNTKSVVQSIMKQMKEDLQHVKKRFHECVMTLPKELDRWIWEPTAFSAGWEQNIVAGKGKQLDLGGAHVFEGDEWIMYSAKCDVTQKDFDITEAFQFGLWRNLSVIPSQTSYVDMFGFDLNEDFVGIGLGIGFGAVLNADCNTPIGYIVHLEGGEEGLPWERATMSCVRSCDAGNCPCDPKVPDHIVGQAECCTKDKPCKEQHGDCDKDEDCETGLVCGSRGNCNTGKWWTEAWIEHLLMNCCTKPTSNCDPGAHPILSAGCCTPNNKCGEGQGDCDSDEDCASGLKCGSCDFGFNWGTIFAPAADCCVRK